MNNMVDIERHMTSFAEAFVMEPRKEKWVDLLCERPDNMLSLSSKLFNYLDHNYIEQNDALRNITTDEMVGVFYDFNDDPKAMSFKAAVGEVKGRDVIFSINPGTLVVFFYHEGWNFVCKR